MKPHLIIFFSAVLSAGSLAAPIALSTGNLVYTQNFDTLPSATNNGAATTAWSDDTTLDGWWFYRAGNAATPTGLAGANFPWFVADGSAALHIAPLAPGFYSVGANAATDRALGGSSTTGLGELSTIAIFHNTTTTPLQLTQVKFTGEAYRANGDANNRDSLFMWWKAAASVSALTTNTTALATTNTTVFVTGTGPDATASAPTSYYITGWTHLPQFNFTNFHETDANVFDPPVTTAFDAAPATAVTVAAGEYLAFRWSNINDEGRDALLGIDDLELTFTALPPPPAPSVSPTESPTITFTPAANGAPSYTPPLNDLTELGWSGGTAASNVQTQPNSGAFTGTAKYFRINGPNTTFVTSPVDVSGIAGLVLEGRIELGLYTSTGTGFENTDVLNARMEVAVDGDFANTAAGNILTQNFIDEPGIDTDTFDDEIAVANPYTNLNGANFPAADFTFHPYVRTISLPELTTPMRARIVFSSGAGITNSEHVLLDNVRFSLGSGTPAADSDGDGQSDESEDIAGTDPNDAASVLRITAAGVSATNEVSLTWSSVAGKNYRAVVSPDLGNPTAWVSAGAVITATGAETSLPPGIVIPGGFPKYFLRIEVVP